MAINVLVDTTSLGAVGDGDTIHIASGTVNMDTNLDQSALAEGLAGMFVARPFTANLGSAAVPLKCDIDSGAGAMFRYGAGAGQCWYQVAGDNNLCHKLQNVGQGTMNLLGTGTVTLLESQGGRTIIGASVVVPTLRVMGGDVRIEGTSGTAPTTVEVSGGSLYTRKGIAGGGSLEIWERGSVIIDALSNTIPTLTFRGGQLEIKQCGTVTTFNLRGGDASRIRFSRPVTITTLNISANVLNAAKFLKQNASLLTIGTTNEIGDLGV